MGWRPQDVRGCALDDFCAAVEGWSEAQGVRPGMSEGEAVDLRRELGWDE